jgi:hypothetical protein
MVPSENIILGAIPSPLLTDNVTKFGFQPLPMHIRSRLTSSSSSTSTDPRYIAFCFDMLSNLSAIHLDTRVAMFRGLTAADNTLGGLGIRGGKSIKSTSLLGSIDSTQMVKNLCASQQYHPMDYFLITFTCNQRNILERKYSGMDCKHGMDEGNIKLLRYEYGEPDRIQKFN